MRTIDKVGVVTIMLALAAIPLMGSGPARVSNPERGKQIVAAQCASCHGMTGDATSANIPNLRGQNNPYIVNQLEAFKSGDRKDPVMAIIAKTLTKDDIRAIADYFSSQKCN